MQQVVHRQVRGWMLVAEILESFLSVSYGYPFCRAKKVTNVSMVSRSQAMSGDHFDFGRWVIRNL